jgi:hypothetical protein
MGQHRQHPAVILRRGEQPELGEHVADVVMKVSVSWCTTAGLGVATWLPSGQFFARSPAAEA